MVIPLKSDNEYIRETLNGLRRLGYPDLEIIVLPDGAEDWGGDVQVIPTGPVGPGRKRDIGTARARGEIVAFLDDDTNPCPDWLHNAVKYFQDPDVAAVGGPAVTPPTDGHLQRASGYVYASLVGGGSYAYRYVPQKGRYVDDYPTCNLLVRRSVMEGLGGFDTSFWPGEDTKLCLEITRGLGKRIVYAPDVVVYHHRRPLFRPHLRQVRSYALHRGYFVKRFPETSLRVSYFLPTLLVAGILGSGILSIFWPAMRVAYLTGMMFYLTAVVVSAVVTCRDLFLSPVVAAGILATHVAYGIWFVVGLLSPRLREERTR